MSTKSENPKLLDSVGGGAKLRLKFAAACPDKFRQLATSSDRFQKSRLVPASPDRLRPVGQDTRTGSQDLQDTLRGAWARPETASDHHNTLSQGPGTFRAVSEGPVTFRKQRQTTGNRSQNDRNHENRRKYTQKARNGLRILPFEAHSHFRSIATPPGPKSHG